MAFDSAFLSSTTRDEFNAESCCGMFLLPLLLLVLAVGLSCVSCRLTLGPSSCKVGFSSPSKVWVHRF